LLSQYRQQLPKTCCHSTPSSKRQPQCQQLQKRQQLAEHPEPPSQEVEEAVPRAGKWGSCSSILALPQKPATGHRSCHEYTHTPNRVASSWQGELQPWCCQEELKKQGRKDQSQLLARNKSSQDKRGGSQSHKAAPWSWTRSLEGNPSVLETEGGRILS
jgi:hypothetical protein